MLFLVTLTVGVLLCQIVDAGGVMNMDHAIPSNNWYVPPLYIPIKEVPYDLSYFDVKCSIIESFVKTMLRDYRNKGELTEEEENNSIESFNKCKLDICGNDAMVKKLSMDPMAMAELAVVMMTLSKEFAPNYDVFRFVVNPVFWDILTDVPYPIVQQEYFYYQNKAAFEIISRVCGHQKITLKAAIIPEVVNKIFLDILVDEYIPSSFFQSDKDKIVTEIEPDALKHLWFNAASFRSKDGICLDSALIKTSERKSISRVRETAKELGLECEGEATIEEDDDEFEIGEGNFGSAPGSPGGSSGPAPGSIPRRSGAAWATAPSSGGGSSPRFAPGT